MWVVSKFIFPPSLAVSAISALSFVWLVRIGYLETRGKHMQYSKFSNIIVGPTTTSSSDGRRRGEKKQKIELRSKVGMLVAYVPAFLLAAASFFWIFPHATLRTFLLHSALALHFFKRIFEWQLLSPFPSLKVERKG
ncbi:very-long-chain enoyl-CoA reductase-like [Senna tora]|uniref:Very-long-chain enoyl-CoA reductase-like n=1 Tax=Senna tora TaxID=362788 RepID=A0A834WBU3_9FABA|nr:very-long-chain enoyl-CoA reductase-like [Senna tora]